MVLLTRLAKQVYRRSSEELLGIHMRLVMALSYLRDHDGAPQQDLAEALCMDANNVVLLLNELEDLGHVARRRDPDDRRRHRVELTDTGRRALIDAERAQETIEDEVLQALDTSERAILWRAVDPRAARRRARRTRSRRHRDRRFGLGVGARSAATRRARRGRPTAQRRSAAAPPVASPEDARRSAERDDRVDLDLRAARQPRHLDRHPRRRILAEERPVHLVDLREGPQVGHVDGHP